MIRSHCDDVEDENTRLREALERISVAFREDGDVLSRMARAALADAQVHEPAVQHFVCPDCNDTTPHARGSDECAAWATSNDAQVSDKEQT